MSNTYVEILRCPDCGTELDHTVRHGLFQAGATSIGPPFRSCPNCGSLISTGKSEWHEKYLFQKVWLLGERLVWFCASSIFLGGIFSMLTVWILEEADVLREAGRQWCFEVTFVIIAVLIGLLFGTNVTREIRASNRRLAARHEES